MDCGHDLCSSLKPLFLVECPVWFVTLEAVGDGVNGVIKVLDEHVTEVHHSEWVFNMEGGIVGYQVVIQHRGEDLRVKVEGGMGVVLRQHWWGLAEARRYGVVEYEATIDSSTVTMK